MTPQEAAGAPGRTTVLVVQQDDGDPLGPARRWLAEEGVGCEVLEAHRGAPVPGRVRGRSGLLVLGGEAGATQDEAHPWLAPVRDLIATTVATGLPFLGVCLGHQMAAVALGGRVTPNPHGPSRGLLPWGPTVPGRGDPLTCALEPGSDVLHWNDDVVVELPTGAVALGSSPDGTVQAARYAPRAWGVQFHPEAAAEVVQGWGHAAPSPSERATVTALRQREHELHAAWAALVRRFGQLLHEG
ncbi:type 1 glutamine amidotransferase [Ornithinimicrobium avium]|uniref:Type 1 glutamine amidotransferase n=1 Tax=Ornithinimicrobium avium TaxID=2283195 RepID=A0A345NRG7_9MICO|nr:type 1 glutamine amidotransferase [Ornithinimicrobium avium]AXH97625.1 type 1 glutamine amidotransferase [Ornithinimicrobium avium]